MATHFPNGISDPLISTTVSAPLGVTANATTYTGIEVVKQSKTLSAASVAFYALPASSAGTVLLSLYAHDASGSDTDNLLGAATVDIETGTAQVEKELTLTSTSGDLDLADGDYVYAKVVSDNSDMTGGTGGVITLKYTVTS